MTLLHDQTLSKSVTEIDTANSLSGAPQGGWPFVGQWRDCLMYCSLWAMIRSDQPGTLWFDFSMDGVSVDRSFPSPIPVYVAGMAQPYQTSPSAQYFRTRFVPASTAPVNFMLQTYFSAASINGPLGPVSRGVVGTARSIVARTAPAGLNPDGTTFSFLTLDSGGSLKTSAEVSNDVGNPLPVSGTVSVGNFPATQPVSLASVPTHAVTQGTSPWVVSLASTTVTGTVAVTQSGSWSVTATPSTSATGVSLTGTLSTTATTADQVIATYTVPNGKTLLLDGADASVCATGLLGGVVALVSVLNLGTVSLVVNNVKIWTGQFAGLTGDRDKTPAATQPTPVAAGTVVKVVCTPGTTIALRWYANISGVLA